MKLSVALPALVFLIAIAAVGCASTGSDVERVLSGYLDATIHERYEEAYSYLCDEDHAAMSLDEFKSENRDNIIIQCDQFTARTSFEVKSVDVEGDAARAEVEITEPHIRVILSDVLGAFIAALLDDEEDLEEMEKELEEKYTEGNIPMRTRTEYYDLVNEGGAWKVEFQQLSQEFAIVYLEGAHVNSRAMRPQ
jgi:hypothetical protein